MGREYQPPLQGDLQVDDLGFFGNEFEYFFPVSRPANPYLFRHWCWEGALEEPEIVCPAEVA